MAKMRAALTAVLTAGLLAAGIGNAAAWDQPKNNGEPVSTVDFDGSTPILTGQAHATQRGNNPFNVQGYAVATVTLSGGIAKAEGPVLCLDVRGNTAGGFVRIAKSTDPAAVGMDMYATFIDGGPGGSKDRMAAGVPVPAGTLTSCAPQPSIALAPFLSGQVTIKDGKQQGGKKQH